MRVTPCAKSVNSCRFHDLLVLPGSADRQKFNAIQIHAESEDEHCVVDLRVFCTVLHHVHLRDSSPATHQERRAREAELWSSAEGASISSVELVRTIIRMFFFGVGAR